MDTGTETAAEASSILLFSKLQWYGTFKWWIVMKMLISCIMMSSSIWSCARRFFFLQAQVAHGLFLLTATPGVTEAIHIIRTDPTMNRDQGRHTLPNIYLEVIKS